MPFRKIRSPYRADIEAALPTYLKSAKNIERPEIATLESKLDDGEKVLYLAGYRHLNMVVVTDRRILKLLHNRFASAEASYRLAEIENISWLTGGALELLISGTRVLILNLPPVQATTLLSAAHDAWRAARAETPALSLNATEPRTNVISQLERLRTLRESGTVTEDEFQAMKADVLGSN